MKMMFAASHVTGYCCHRRPHVLLQRIPWQIAASHVSGFCSPRGPSRVTRNRSKTAFTIRHLSSSPSGTTSTGSSSTARTSVFPFSSASLGLEPSFVQPHLPSISQLPEIKSFLPTKKDDDTEDSTTTLGSEESLQRAKDIFMQFQPGGNEHKAVLALLAEYQQRHGDYNTALETLQQLRDYCDSARREIDVLLAKSKVHWLAGEFSDAQEICESLLQEEGSVLEDSLPLHYAAARSGQALTRLLTAESLDDAFTLRDPARMTVKFLEQQQQPSSSSSLPFLPLVAAQLNLGVAEVVYAEIIQKENDVEAPTDSAMRAWRKGLNMLKSQNLNSNEAFFLEAQLQMSMAWVLLSKSTAVKSSQDKAASSTSSSSRNNAKDEEDLSRALKLASKALKVYDDNESSNHTKEGLGRALSLVATCYHRAGQAVTAEGLFQSALSSFGSSSSSQPHVVNPQEVLEKKDALQAFANLCRDWDRREGDAKKYDSQATEMDASLPSMWQGKSGIHSSLWFWTPNTFLYYKTQKDSVY